jgi:hypothetical protein
VLEQRPGLHRAECRDGNGDVSVGPHWVFGTIDLGTDLGSELPPYEQFELGGFLNLSGLERGAARGDVKGLATFGYFFQSGTSA